MLLKEIWRIILFTHHLVVHFEKTAQTTYKLPLARVDTTTMKISVR